MTATISAAPAILTLALRPLPLMPVQFLLSRILAAAVRQHRCILDRLGVHADKRFGIDPADMPFAFVLEPRPDEPRLAVVRSLPVEIDARITGTLAALHGLACGTLDGDALFFSRDLTIEGDVEAILALRNALDDAGVDLIGVAASCLGPLDRPFREAARIAGSILAPLVRAHPWN